jgi:hypothetical protein
VARHIFQACPVWIYTQSNITQAPYSPEYITPTKLLYVLSPCKRTKNLLICFSCKIMLKNYVLTHATLHLKSIVSSKSVSVWRPDISKFYSLLYSVIYN